MREVDQLRDEIVLWRSRTLQLLQIAIDLNGHDPNISGPLASHMIKQAQQDLIKVGLFCSSCLRATPCRCASSNPSP